MQVTLRIGSSGTFHGRPESGFRIAGGCTCRACETAKLHRLAKRKITNRAQNLTSLCAVAVKSSVLKLQQIFVQTGWDVSFKSSLKDMKALILLPGAGAPVTNEVGEAGLVSAMVAGLNRKTEGLASAQILFMSLCYGAIDILSCTYISLSLSKHFHGDHLVCSCPKSTQSLS